MARIAITGSSGLVGSALRHRLESDGHEAVRVLRGDPSNVSAVWNPEAGWIRPGALQGCKAVVHLAGASIGEGRWTARRRAELRTSRIDATRLLVDHLATLARPPALVSASAVGYYGNRGDEILTEESAPGTGFLAELTRDWEAEAARAREAGITVTILRLGVVLSREGGALPRILLPFRLGVGGRLGNGRQWMSWLTLDDAVGAIEHAITTRLDGVFNAVSPEPVTNRDFTRALGRALRRPALFPAPAFGLRLLLGGSADELLLWSQRVLSQKLEDTGYRFQHPDLGSALDTTLGSKRQT